MMYLSCLSVVTLFDNIIVVSLVFSLIRFFWWSLLPDVVIQVPSILTGEFFGTAMICPSEWSMCDILVLLTVINDAFLGLIVRFAQLAKSVDVSCIFCIFFLVGV